MNNEHICAKNPLHIIANFRLNFNAFEHAIHSLPRLVYHGKTQQFQSKQNIAQMKIYQAKFRIAVKTLIEKSARNNPTTRIFVFSHLFAVQKVNLIFIT